MMDNLAIYNAVAAVPDSAKKKISGGRISGFTDINPMWRIKILTEMFGPVGFGWKYIITDKRIIDGADGKKCAFVDVELYVKRDEVWSEAIPGTGGSMFVSSESKGLYTNDECFKMALTDAISVACKALGIGADVYWQEGRTKYNPVEIICPECGEKVTKQKKDTGEIVPPEVVFEKCGNMCFKCWREKNPVKNEGGKNND